MSAHGNLIGITKHVSLLLRICFDCFARVAGSGQLHWNLIFESALHKTTASTPLVDNWHLSRKEYTKATKATKQKMFSSYCGSSNFVRYPNFLKILPMLLQTELWSWGLGLSSSSRSYSLSWVTRTAHCRKNDVAKIMSNCLLLATSFCERHCGLSSAVMWCAKLLGQLWICRSKMMRSPKLPIQSKYIQIIHLVYLNPSSTLQETCPQHCLLPASLQDIWARLTTPRHVIQWWKRQLQSFARSSLGLDLLELPGVQGLKWDKSWQHEVSLQGRKSFSVRLWGFTELFCHSSVQMEADVRQQL
jgi:hypothetical protein